MFSGWLEENKDEGGINSVRRKEQVFQEEDFREYYSLFII